MANDDWKKSAMQQASKQSGHQADPSGIGVASVGSSYWEDPSWRMWEDPPTEYLDGKSIYGVPEDDSWVKGVAGQVAGQYEAPPSGQDLWGVPGHWKNLADQERARGDVPYWGQEGEARKQYQEGLGWLHGRATGADSIVQSEAERQREAMGRSIQSQLATMRGGASPAERRAAQYALAGREAASVGDVALAKMKEQQAAQQAYLQATGQMRGQDLQAVQQQQQMEQFRQQMYQKYMTMGLYEKEAIMKANQDLMKLRAQIQLSGGIPPSGYSSWGDWMERTGRSAAGLTALLGNMSDGGGSTPTPGADVSPGLGPAPETGTSPGTGIKMKF